MKITIFTILAFTAQSLCQVELLTSAPFKLVLRSTNATFDGHYLSTCRANGDFRNFCVNNNERVDQYSTFNTESNRYPGNLSNGFDPVAAGDGRIKWLFPLTGGDVPMYMRWDVESVATGGPQQNTWLEHALFDFSYQNATWLWFNSTGSMYIYEGYIPDGGHSHQIYHESHNWYMCDMQQPLGLTGLTWVPRDSVPNVANCQKVDVFRVLA